MGKNVIIDGNSRDGALFAKTGHYLGTRRGKNGRFEEKIFNGKEWEAKRDWRIWRDELKKVDTVKVTETQVTKSSNDDTLYVLTLTIKGVTKCVNVFYDEDEAYKVADSLSTALEMSGIEGDYDVQHARMWS